MAVQSFPDFASPLLFGLLFATGLVGNVLWYRVKLALRREGKEVSWFVDHFRDFRLLKEVIAESRSEAKRERFKKLLAALYWMSGVFLLLVGLVFVSFLTER